MTIMKNYHNKINVKKKKKKKNVMAMQTGDQECSVALK